MTWWTPHEDARLANYAKQGMSASSIALSMGRTRNSVIGRTHRLSLKLKGKPFGNPGSGRARRRASQPQQPRVKAAKALPDRIVKIARPMAVTPLPEPVVRAGESHIAGRPMTMLAAHECRFAVNAAGVGELHLFCGLPTDGQWCEHHRSVVYQRPVSIQHPKGA